MALDPKPLDAQDPGGVQRRPSSWPSSRSNPEVTPDHLLAGHARPGGHRRPARPRARSALAPLGRAQPDSRRPLAKLPHSYGSDGPAGPRAAASALDRADAERDDARRRVPLDRAPAAGPGRPARRQPRGPARGPARRPRQPPGHQPEPRGAVPGPREVRPRPHRGRPQGQARPGHRPRRGDPPRHPGAVPPDQEQPGAHRRARRRQDRHRRGPGPPHRRGRRPREPARTSGCSRSTSARWSPAPSTAASSRSG